MAEETVDRIRSIVEVDDRYRVQAYVFTLEALNYTLAKHRRSGHEGHIDGRTLLLGLREYARKQFGYLARAVFASWGVHRTGDFGEIVFNLVDASLLSKQESDTKADFEGVYEFTDAFEAQFVH